MNPVDPVITRKNCQHVPNIIRMALPDIRKIPPVSIYEFRNITESDTFYIPEIPKRRKCTDKIFLFFFIATILMTIVLALTSSIIKSNYNRFLHGYDKCGDTCASKNDPIRSVNCSGKDLTTKTIMKYQFIEEKKHMRLLPDECVDECEPPNRFMFQRCIPWNDQPVDKRGNYILTFLEFVDDLQKTIIIVIVPMCVVGFVLSLGLFLCFHYCPRNTVFVTLVFSALALLLFTGYLWYWYFHNVEDNTLLYVSVLVTILTFFLSTFVCYFYTRYSLVIEMFIEATNVIFQMPSLIFLPLLTLLLLTAVVALIVFLICILSTHQSLYSDEKFPKIYDFQITPVAEAAITYLCLTGIWIFAFVNGCQCFVVAGPVSYHYFLNDDAKVKFPVLRSMGTLLRYHLGTVAFGSLFVTLVTGVRFALEFIQDRLKCTRTMTCLEYVVACLEPIVEYLTKRSYIQTAMHGMPLYKSGMRAARLMWANLMDTLSLDVVADFTIICATILVTLITVAVAIFTCKVFKLELNYFWSILAVGIGVVGTIIYFFMQIINVAVETIFLCFCEDKLLNNGKDRPYCMSSNLKLLVEKAKNVAKKAEDN